MADHARTVRLHVCILKLLLLLLLTLYHQGCSTYTS
jgi:hypothetical protein